MGISDWFSTGRSTANRQAGYAAQAAQANSARQSELAQEIFDKYILLRLELLVIEIKD